MQSVERKEEKEGGATAIIERHVGFLTRRVGGFGRGAVVGYYLP